jgi:hypothetical protein
LKNKDIVEILIGAYFIIFALIIGVLLPIAYSFNKNLFEQIYSLCKANKKKKDIKFPVKSIRSYCYYSDQVIYMAGIYSFAAILTPFIYYLLPVVPIIKLHILRFLWLEYILVSIAVSLFSLTDKGRKDWNGREWAIAIINFFSLSCFFIVYLNLELFKINNYILITIITIFVFYLLWHLGAYIYKPLTNLTDIHKSLLE